MEEYEFVMQIRVSLKEEEIMNLLENVKFHLCDTNKSIVDSWNEYFNDYDNFTIHHRDLIETFLEKQNDAAINENETQSFWIVSPANSFGDMQGGIDLAYFTHFGWQIEEKVRSLTF